MRFSVRLDFFNENFLVAVRSRVFQSARVPAESVLPVFRTQRGLRLKPFQDVFRSDVTGFSAGSAGRPAESSPAEIKIENNIM